jgi:Kdo2-lipid IVA lauroyltransferase/acyltransferase
MFYFAMILLKLLGFLLSLLPLRLRQAVGAGLGALLLRAGFRRRVAEENLALAFPYLGASERQRFLQEHYRELGQLFLELAGSFYRFDRFVSRHVKFENEHHLRGALEMGKGAFVMTAHLGNWEVLSASGPVLFGTGVTMVTKKLKPEWFHRVVAVTRELLGVKMAWEPRTMQGILRALKKQEVVGFVMDQYAGAPVGARVPFFGIPVGSQTALAALALRTGAPVVPAVAIRKPDGRFVVRFDPPLPTLEEEDQERAILKNTAAYVRHTEAWIKEFPLQWTWIHRRWKGDLSPLPPGAVGEMLK